LSIELYNRSFVCIVSLPTVPSILNPDFILDSNIVYVNFNQTFPAEPVAAGSAAWFIIFCCNIALPEEYSNVASPPNKPPGVIVTSPVVYHLYKLCAAEFAVLPCEKIGSLNISNGLSGYGA